MNLSQPGITKITSILVPLLDRMQVIDASQDWTVPGTGNYLVIAIGGGGAGGSGGNGGGPSTYGGDGGKGGAMGEMAIGVLSLTANDVYSITIGAGAQLTVYNSGYNIDGNGGNPGDDTKFGSLMTAKGGMGGNAGMAAVILSQNGNYGGNGAGPGGGQGGFSVISAVAGNDGGDATGYGGGGGGGGGTFSNGPHGGNGGRGHSGVVVILW